MSTGPLSSMERSGSTPPVTKTGPAPHDVFTPNRIRLVVRLVRIHQRSGYRERPQASGLNATSSQFKVRVGLGLPLLFESVQGVEGDDGTTEYQFDVQPGVPTTTDVAFDWSTADGTAIAGSDYVAAADTVCQTPLLRPRQASSPWSRPSATSSSAGTRPSRSTSTTSWVPDLRRCTRATSSSRFSKSSFLYSSGVTRHTDELEGHVERKQSRRSP